MGEPRELFLLLWSLSVELRERPVVPGPVCDGARDWFDMPCVLVRHIKRAVCVDEKEINLSRFRLSQLKYVSLTRTNSQLTYLK